MTWLPIAYAVACIFLAAIVRGYSGFGFSLLAITALTLMLPPLQVIPAIFMLEIVASLRLLPEVWRQVHWRSLLPLLIGCIIATPVGIWFLANLPAAPMKISLGIFVLACTVLLWRGYALQRMPGRMASAAAGAASGLANGAFGIGGPPVILFYFASPAGAIAGRASLIAYFMAIDFFGLLFFLREDLLTWESFKLAALFLPALLAGVWLGSCSFKSADPEAFRRWVLVILAVLAALILVQGIQALTAA
jgi:uncharacterized protein